LVQQNVSIFFNVVFSRRTKGKYYRLNSSLSCMSVSRYGSNIFVRCFCDFTSGGRKLTKITFWQVAAYEQVSTAHRDRPEPRAAAQRRMTQWSQRKREDLTYLLPIAVGINLQVWEQVRKLAHARIGSPTAIAKAHRLRAASCTEDMMRCRNKAAATAIAKDMGPSNGRPRSLPLNHQQRQHQQQRKPQRHYH
jgi:hypothetical protein